MTLSDTPNSSPFSRRDRVYIVLAVLFVTLLILTNIIGQKLFVLFGETLTAGLITYPLTFLITDVVSEVYGKRRADRMVIMGFAMTLVMLVIVQISIALPASPIWGSTIAAGLTDGPAMQNAWLGSFGVGWWLVTGSMCAYLIAQLIDNWLFHFWRQLTNGKHLWLRNNGSTMFSQLVDTFIVNSFLFYGAFGWEFVVGLKVMAVIYLFKLAIAALDTPFCYLAIGGLRRYLAVEQANNHTDIASVKA
ncbi:MAG: queuosine precursor transporter, partial [Immundisolibacteraceae bacterium]|nr:queuosine precursor transporter [Immundisolibacteraceae bacterium]